MPKQIPNLKMSILAQARDILMTQGYRALSMRAVASRCGIACGTLYNYFPGKEELVAAITLEDWQSCLANMNMLIRNGMDAEQGLVALCRELCSFTQEYRLVWEQYGAGGRAASYAPRYRGTLRTQLALPVHALLPQANVKFVNVLVEAMLSCAMNEDLGADAFCLLASRLALDGYNLKDKDG